MPEAASGPVAGIERMSGGSGQCCGTGAPRAAAAPAGIGCAFRRRWSVASWSRVGLAT